MFFMGVVVRIIFFGGTKVIVVEGHKEIAIANKRVGRCLSKDAVFIRRP